MGLVNGDDMTDWPRAIKCGERNAESKTLQRRPLQR